MILKNLKRILTIVLMIIIGITLFKSNYSYAIGGNPSKSTLQSDGGGKPQLDSEKLYKDQNYYKPTTEEMPAKLQNIVGVILGGIRTLGIILSVICLMAIGIKFMVGSVEQKAEYKKVFPGYILGVVLIGAMTLIPSIIYNIVNDLKWI